LPIFYEIHFTILKISLFGTMLIAEKSRFWMETN